MFEMITASLLSTQQPVTLVDQVELESLNLIRTFICFCDKCYVIFDDNLILLPRCRPLRRKTTLHPK